MLAIAREDRRIVVRHTSRSGVFGDHVEHRLNIGRRAGDDAEDLDSSLVLLLQRFL